MATIPKKIPAEVEKRLHDEQVIWLTTVRADGTPLPTPVSFLWDGETVLIYTTPNSLKLHNIAKNPRAALNLNSDEWGREVVVLIGEIVEDRATPPVIQNAMYLEKYRESIMEKYRVAMSDFQITLESFSQKYSVPLRFTPERIRVF
jgi:PPOX class probable F420-dependent enzyme